MNSVGQAFRFWCANSTFLRVLIIGFVVLLLQIPISMINDQISDRQWTQRYAIDDVTSKWGAEQSIQGPRLVIPYYEVSKWKNKEGELKQSRLLRYASFLPDTLQVQSQVKNESRYRGLFEVPLYQSTINLKGAFSKPDFRRWGMDSELILWDKAELVLAVSDASGIQQQTYLQWNNQVLEFEPGMGDSNHSSPGFYVRLIDGFSESEYKYNIDLVLNGSQRLEFSPMGEESHIAMQSNWPDPSFQGFKLPTIRNITASGFDAEWHISSISRSYPQQWLHHEFDLDKLGHSYVGVSFIAPVDHYRMTERSIKYAVLFLLFTFSVIWLVELVARIRVHHLQYLFIGLGVCVFYLLLLALSEHLGFFQAYIVASVAVILMITGYSRSVLKTNIRASIVSLVSITLYVYLFILLQEKNYALLLGAIGVFVALGVTMYLTRNIDWYAVGKAKKITVKEES